MTGVVRGEARPCRRCQTPTEWTYLSECFWCAKHRLEQEDADPSVPVVIDPAVRAILEGSSPP